VHRSYVVAVDKIDSMEAGLLIVNGKPLPVADAYRSTLNKRMNIL
jgi:DNA-binding LytR/AlgR family response regulator